MHISRMVSAFAVVTAMLLAGCGPSELPREVLSSSDGEVAIDGDVWADNWFALYLGDQLLIEDSVSITTERSFNAESFSFKADYPLVLNFILKDFKENDSGLEYIGTGRQQLGDGGFIAQFKEAQTGKLIAATSDQWKCLVLHHGPVDESCEAEESPIAGTGPCDFVVTEEPADWKSANFSDATWQQAKVYTSADVRPKDGYDQIRWDPGANLIWANDLKKDNTILIRVVIEDPNETAPTSAQ